MNLSNRFRILGGESTITIILVIVLYTACPVLGRLLVGKCTRVDLDSV